MSRPLRSTIITAVLATLLAGGIEGWAGRRSYVAGDTISYIDMARRIGAGDYTAVVNGHWSPLYPVILAVFIRPFQSDSTGEFAAVRVVDFLIFAVALACFYQFVGIFFESYYKRYERRQGRLPLLSETQFHILAYALFLWCSLGLTIVSRVNPDILVAAFVFSGCSVLLLFQRGKVTPGTFALFGLLLGVGYWAKAIFFPLSFVFFAAAALVPAVWKHKSRLLLSVAIFTVIAAPLVAMLSIRYGRFTFGESGRDTYLMDILGLPDIHWQGDQPGSGTPVHPTRRILRSPDVLEFAGPIPGTYPPWDDPAYWIAGAKMSFTIRQEWAGIVRSMKYLARASWIVIPAVLLLLGMRRGLLFSRNAVSEFRSLWLVGGGIVAIYLPLLIELRYVSAALPILVIVAMAALERETEESRIPVSNLVVVMLLSCIVVEVGPHVGQAALVLARTKGRVQDQNWLVAEEFERVGIPANTPVAAMDHFDTNHWSAARIGDWAALARVHVVSEVFQIPYSAQTEFWRYPRDRQTEVLRVLARTGARIVVASGVPSEADTTGWTQIRDSRYYYCYLPSLALYRH
jgi:hypothetical protein